MPSTSTGCRRPNAKKISVQGAVLLVLERHDRISLTEQASGLPGATGLRALAAVLSQHGEQTMLTVYDKAALLRPGRAVVDTTVNLAVRGLLTPRRMGAHARLPRALRHQVPRLLHQPRHATRRPRRLPRPTGRHRRARRRLDAGARVRAYVGFGYLNSSEVLLAAGVEGALRAAREALLDVRRRPATRASPEQ